MEKKCCACPRDGRPHLQILFLTPQEEGDVLCTVTECTAAPRAAMDREPCRAKGRAWALMGEVVHGKRNGDEGLEDVLGFHK